LPAALNVAAGSTFASTNESPIDQDSTEKVIVTIPIPEGDHRFFARLRVSYQAP
jgi:hypothetical protein